jgi:glycosyltransferase involved in cell wall biosynthesis
VITVIIPVHNASPYLPKALANLKKLESPELEFVVVNDHSTDDSGERVREWHQSLSNLVAIDSVGRGVAAARNEAVNISRGQFLWFTDCDDDWDVNIVRRMHAAACATSADIVVCNARKVVLGGGPETAIVDAPLEEILTGSQALGSLLRGDLQGHLWNKLFRRSLFESITFPPTRAHSDLGGMFALFASAERVSLLPETLYTYYLHGGSILNQKAYRWDDLWDCLEIADSAVDTAGKRTLLCRDLITFKYRNVLIPIINETVRRDSWEQKATISAQRQQARSRIKIGDLLALTRMGQFDALVRGLLILMATPLYVAVYRRHRRKTMGSVDAATSGSQ